MNRMTCLMVVVGLFAAVLPAFAAGAAQPVPDLTTVGIETGPAFAPVAPGDGNGGGGRPPTDDSMWVQLEQIQSQGSYQGVCVVGDTLYYAYQSGAVHVRSRVNGNLIRQFTVPQVGTTIAIAVFGDSICVTNLTNGCYVYTLGGTYCRSFTAGMPQARGLDWDGDKFWATSYSGGALTIYTMTRTGTVLKQLTRSGGLAVNISIARDLALDHDIPNRLWSSPNTSSPYTAMYVGFDTSANTYAVLDTFEHGWGSYIACMGYYTDPTAGGCVYSKTFSQTTIQKVKVHNPVASDDVGVNSLLAPASVEDSGVAVVPACSVYNYGATTVSYDVRMTIGSAYDTVAAVSSHAPGTSQYVAFPAWTPDVLGNVAVVCSTELAGDGDPGNDSLAQTTFVRKLDAGVVSITSPTGSHLPGDTAFPAATWHNHGNTAADFEAWVMLTDPTDAEVYREKVDLAGVTPGGDILVSSFPAHVLVAPGDWVVRCSTGLAGDANPANDELQAGFRVVPPGSPDLGVKLIEAPKGRLDTMVDVTPEARLRNYGDVEAGGMAWFVLFDPTDAEVYRESVAVAPIPVNGEASAFFPVYNVGATLGDWTTRCSVYVAGDVGATNDVLEGSFTVNSFPDWPSGWVEVASMPQGANTVKDGGWLAYDEGGGLVYATKGNKTNEFYGYDAWADTWTRLADVPNGTEGKPPRKGSRGICDGRGSIYATKGNNTLGFYIYDIATNVWTQLPDVPEGPNGKKVKGGTDLAFVEKEGTGYVYLLKGYKTEFYRFNTVTNAWEPLENVPWILKEKWNKGSWMAYKEGRGHGGERYLYAHQANYYDRALNEHHMFRYDLANDSWDHTPLHGMPLFGLHGGRIRKKKSKDGSAGAYHDDMIYALKGGNSQQFFAYDVLADSWTELDTMPTFGSTAKRRRVKYGADLISWGGGAFFALKGNKTNEFWRYVTWPVPEARPERSGVMGGRTGQLPVGLTCAPNPLAGGYATVRYSLPKAGAASISVFDVTGRTVLRRSVVATRTGAVSLDVRSLSAGTYLVRLETDGWNGTQKLVVQR